MSQQNITAVNVFIEIDGKQCISIIKPEMADLFLRMLGTFQSGEYSGTTLTLLPDQVTKHLLATRRAFKAHVEDQKKRVTQPC